jgi:hypothetical protein
MYIFIIKIYLLIFLMYNKRNCSKWMWFGLFSSPVVVSLYVGLMLVMFCVYLHGVPCSLLLLVAKCFDSVPVRVVL